MRPTYCLDFKSSTVKEKANQLMGELQTKGEIAVTFFYFVRDEIKYRLTTDMFDKENFKASATLKRGYGFCIPKAILLASLLRAAGIPSHLHFADIRNHCLPPKILELLRTDLLIYHAYVELFIGGRWIKATPTFDIEMCKKYNIIPVEFTGMNDALFHRLDCDGRLHIEYVADHVALLLIFLILLYSLLSKKLIPTSTRI